jgi:uncharacterized phage protein (TIGR01671 family)
MREILFRGKRKDNGEWIYGDLLNVGVDYDYAIRTYGGREHGEVNAVNEKTVGQYTGLTDNNGNKIFEGDVVEATIVRDLGGGKQTKSDIGLVGYDSLGMLGIILHYDDNVPVWSDVLIELSLSCTIDDFCFEVIGNIHDNPELLKGAYNA